MLLGEGLVGVNHRVIPTSTQRMTIKEILHAPNLLHNGSPYVHATGITNLNTSISTIPNYSTSMTLISPSSCLKTSSSIKLLIVFNTLYMKVTTYETHYMKNMVLL